MKELRRDGRVLLDEARRERTPDAATRERVYTALLASAALTGGVSTAPPRRRRLDGARKWLVLAGLAGLVTGALYLASHAKTRSRAAPTPAPVVASARRLE